MKYVIILFVLMTNYSHAIIAHSPADVWSWANSAYQEQQWDEAITHYKDLDQMNLGSPELYANLGNAFYKKGELGEAIYYFKKSLKLDPSNKDVKYNLKLVSKDKIDDYDLNANTGIESFWSRTLAIFGADNLAYLSVFCSLLTLIGFGWFLLKSTSRKKRLGLNFGLFSFIVGILALWMSFTAKRTALEMNHGIVMAKKVEIKGEPNKTATEVFTLHEGTEVLIKNRQEGWYEISLGDNLVGWAKMSEVRAF